MRACIPQVTCQCAWLCAPVPRRPVSHDHGHGQRGRQGTDTGHQPPVCGRHLPDAQEHPNHHILLAAGYIPTLVIVMHTYSRPGDRMPLLRVKSTWVGNLSITP